LAFVSIRDKRPRGRHAVAAVPISIEIDEMLALFLQTRGLDEIAFDLIDRLKAICDHLKFIAIFAEASAESPDRIEPQTSSRPAQATLARACAGADRPAKDR
jgi:hypothetical protein